MKSSKKLIALICSLAMIFSVFANFTVVSADAAQGMVITVDTDNSTDTAKKISVKYVGMPDGIAAYTVKFDVPAGATVTDVTSGLAGEITDLTDNVYTAGATSVDNVKCADDVFFSATINLASELTEDFTLKLKEGTVMSDESGTKYAITKGTLAVTDAVLEAPVPEPTAIPDATPVEKGINLTLDEASSTDTEKVVKVSYAGFDDGIAAYTVKVNVPEGATVEADSKLAGAITDLTDGVFTVGATAVDNVKADDSVFATLKVTLAEPLSEDFVMNLLTGSVLGDEMGTKIAISKGTMPETYVVFRAAAAATDAPAETTAPTAPAETTAPTAPAETTAPTTPAETTGPTAAPADIRPTAIPAATEAPAAEETEAPAGPTAVPDAAPVEKGINLTVDEDNSTDTEKIIKVSYAGFDDGIAAYTVKVNVPEGATVEADSKLAGAITDLTDGVFTVGATAVDNVKADDSVFATLKVKLAEPLSEDFVMNLLTGSVLGDEMGSKIAISKGTMPETYVVLRAPVPEATATPEPTETPEPTATPEPVGEKDLTDIIDADKAVDGTYVTIKTEDGKDAVYGVDYVAKDKDGNVVDPTTFQNDIWGYGDGTVADAIKKYTIVAYNPIKVNLNDGTNIIDGGEITDVEPTTEPKPTAEPGVEFSQWSARSVTTTKSSTKQSTATFTGIPKDAKNIKITFSTDDDKLIKITEGSTSVLDKDDTKTAKATVKVTAKQNKKSSATVTATLEYTLDGEKYYLDSTDLNVNTRTTSSSSGGSGGSGGSSGGNVIATGTTTSPIFDPGVIASVNFTDLGEAEWARDAINYLAERGIVNGRTATTFEPNGYITRAEFAKLVVTVFGITPSEGIEAISFPDVQSGSWYTAYVMTAAHYGIVTGYPDGLFRPDALVSRQEMALMMDRACKIFGIQLPAINAPIAFTDGVADWAAAAVTDLQVAGVVNGTSATTFGPTDASTRAQAAQMIYNLYAIVV